MKKTCFVFTLLMMTTIILAQQLAVPGEYSTIQAAIEAASEGDTVLVDEGTYTENISFLGKSITVASKYILDGDENHITNTVINGSQPVNPDTASTVLFISGEDEHSCLVGFTITGGKGTIFYDYQPDYGEFTTRGGGGIMIIDGGATIERNMIVDNTCDDDMYSNGAGGIGIYISEDNDRSDQDSILIRHNTIKGNMAVGKPTLGGGIYALVDKSDPGVRLDLIIQDNLITENKLYSSVAQTNSYGAAICIGFDMPIRDGNFIIRDNVITKNVIEHTAGTQWASGGGVYIFYLGSVDNDNTAPWFINNVIADNVVPGYGGGTSLFYFNTGKIHNPRPIYINNTIVDNEAGWNGSAFHFHCSNPYLLNNIVWNQLNGSVNEIWLQGNYHEIIARNNTIQGGWDMQYNLATVPGFITDTWDLSESSLCIGRGADSIEVNGTWYLAPELDMKGNTRKGVDRIDLGALESSFTQVDHFLIDTIIEVDGLAICDVELTASYEGGTPPFTYYFDGTEIEDLTVSGLCSGTYEFSIEDADENTASKSIIVENDFVDEIEEAKAQTDALVVYPNPGNDVINVRFPEPGPYTIEIISPVGQIVHSAYTAKASWQIDLDGFSKGIYLIRVQKENWSVTEKLMIH